MIYETTSAVFTNSEIDAEMDRLGCNRHEAAKSLELRTKPSGELAANVKQARGKLDAAKKETDAAEEALRQSASDLQTFLGRLAEAQRLQKEIEQGESELAFNLAAIENLPRTLLNWPTDELQRRGAVNMVLEAAGRARTFAEFLPGWIERRKKALVKFENQTAEFATGHGIEKTK